MYYRTEPIECNNIATKFRNYFSLAFLCNDISECECNSKNIDFSVRYAPVTNHFEYLLSTEKLIYLIMYYGLSNRFSLYTLFLDSPQH